MLLPNFVVYRYLEKYADPSDEPVSQLYDQSFEDMDLAVEKWKGTQRLMNDRPIFNIYIDHLSFFVCLFPAELVFKEVISFVPQPLNTAAEAH